MYVSGAGWISDQWMRWLIDLFSFTYIFYRTVLLRLSSIAVLMITLYVDEENRCNDDPVTCCQQVRDLAGVWTRFLIGGQQDLVNSLHLAIGPCLSFL